MYSVIPLVALGLGLQIAPSGGQASTSQHGCVFADDQYVYNVQLRPESRDLVCPTSDQLQQNAQLTTNRVNELKGLISNLQQMALNLQARNTKLRRAISRVRQELQDTKQAVAEELGLHQCPPGYHVYNEPAKSCYQFISHYFDWYKAELYCMSTGGHLVALESDAENEFLSNYAEQHNVMPGKHIWTGGNDIAEENVWYWTGINQRFNYTNWLLYPHEHHGNIQMPDNYLDMEHCIHLFHLHDYQWNDLYCRNKHYFVCEYKLL